MNINESRKLIVGAREDIKNHWSGNSDARESADKQLSAALGYLEPGTTIKTFFDDLRAITNESYGSVKDQLQAGEGNTRP